MRKTFQEDHERAVGNHFIEWLNAATGEQFEFLRRGVEKVEPDLIYHFGEALLNLEVTDAYYDPNHARFIWKDAVGEPDAEQSWTGMNPDISLAEAVRKRILEKSVKTYAESSILLINIPPGMTSAEELQRLLESQPLPSMPFIGVYLVGRFPTTARSTGGSRVLCLKSRLIQLP